MKNKSPFEKEQDVHNRTLSFLKANPRGVHITDIAKETGISRKTLEKHLNTLEYENQIYCKHFGPTKVYYPNRKVHHIDFDILRLKNRTIWADVMDNEFGVFLLIQEKKLINKSWVSKGSILIPIENSREFVGKVSKLINSERIRNILKVKS